MKLLFRGYKRWPVTLRLAKLSQGDLGNASFKGSYLYREMPGMVVGWVGGAGIGFREPVSGRGG